MEGEQIGDVGRVSGYLCDEHGEPYNAETFQLDEYLASIPMLEEALGSSAGRKELTKDDPLLWACTYTPHLLRSPEGEMTFGDVHLGLYRDAMALRSPAGPEGDRRAYVAPRGSGKSTTLFVITTLWLACHYPTFIAAFSASATQAKDHLHAVRGELSTNKLIREDYPLTCAPVLKPSGLPVADSDQMLYTKSGFCFSARGVDTEVLGLVDPTNRRPQVIWLDDCEGAEGSGYSLYQAEQRLKTITDGILPMNDRAHVRLVGTVTIVGGIMHDLVSVATTNAPPRQWIKDERWEVTYFPPIVTRTDGTERSCWPGRWPMALLEAIRHTRSFLKNFANQPVGADGGYWTEADITYGTLDTLTRRLLVIDPATTAKRSSDRTGIAIVAYSPTEGRCVVEHAEGVHLTGKRLADHLRRLIGTWPTRLAALIVEVNQGGDLWGEVFDQLPIKVIPRTASEPKEVRFARALDWYQKRPQTLVLHAAKFPLAEAEMFSFPRGANDDVADAVCGGLQEFLNVPVKVRVGSRSVAYT